jgi:hypothetical protein
MFQGRWTRGRYEGKEKMREINGQDEECVIEDND